MMLCPKCNLPRLYGPASYAGPQCQCVLGHYEFKPAQFTEEDIRRIVREELERISPVKEDK